MDISALKKRIKRKEADGAIMISPQTVLTLIEDYEQLLLASQAWRGQGHRSRWSAEKSLRLVDIVDQQSAKHQVEKPCNEPRSETRSQ